MPAIQRGYLPIGQLEMYYEVHGAGEPLVLLHGGFTTIELSFEKLLPGLAQKHRVIALEQQAHGRTRDIDRPLDFVQMASDTAAALQQLQITRADFLGFSDGGILALGLAIHHPTLVRRMILAGANYDNSGLDPDLLDMMEHMDASMVPALREAYEKVAPDPSAFPDLVDKVAELCLDFPGWSHEQLRAIKAEALIVSADRDAVLPEHSVSLFRLLARAQLAILPGSDHKTLMQRSEWLLPMISAFLDKD
jgi:pimeloyl-ACP methyl ester carboxylesterase